MPWPILKMTAPKRLLFLSRMARSTAGMATAAGTPTTARTTRTGASRTRATGATIATRAISAGTGRATACRTRTASRRTRTTRASARTRAARLVAVRIEAARACVVGREVRCIAGMAVGLGRAARSLATTATGAARTALATGATRTAFADVAAASTFALALAAEAAFATRATAFTLTAAKTTFATRAAIAVTTAAASAATRTLVAVRLLGATVFRIAMPGRAGLDAFGHVPGTERGGIAFRQRTRTLFLALLERLLRLLRRHFAADGQAAVRLLATAATAAVFAHMIEAAQFAAFVSGVVAADVTLRAGAAGEVDGRLGRLALADHRLQRQRRRRIALEAEFTAQRFDLLGGEFLRLAAQQFARQRDLAVAHALEAADLAALRFPQAAHFAVAAFLHHDAEPVVPALLRHVATADAFDLVELGRAVFQRDATGEAVDEVVRHHVLAFRCAHAADVFAVDFERGMHQRIGEFTVGGEQQQAGSVDVEAADRDPARALEHRQRLEHGRTPFGVFARGHFAFGLVVHQHAGGFGQRGRDKDLAVDLDLVAAGDALADRGGFAVDLHQSVGDALFQRAARA